MQKLTTATADKSLGNLLRERICTTAGKHPTVMLAEVDHKFAAARLRKLRQPASPTIIKPTVTSTAPLGSGPAPLPVGTELPGFDLSGIDPAHRGLVGPQDPFADLYRAQAAARQHVLDQIKAAREPVAAAAFAQTLLRTGGTG